MLYLEAKLDHQLMQNVLLRMEQAAAAGENEDDPTSISAQQAA